MSGPKISSKSPTIRRILKEAAELSNSPSPDYTATPLESDLFEWHFTMRGPPNSSFAEGIYHGRIVLPPTYPLRPPMFRFTTPSGRFEPNREICLSISGHHEETWQPAWGVRTALVALRTFMETDAKGQLGGLDTSDAVRRRFAAESRNWRCPACARTNLDIINECEAKWKELEAENGETSEVKVPEELKMGFRDEMGKPKAEGETLVSTAGGEDAESAQLAEGFVQTAPDREVLPPAVPQPQSRVAAAAPASGPSPFTSVPPPTRTTPRVPLPDPAGRSVAQRPRPYDPNAGVPPWLDYAIMSLVVMLLAMLFKVLFGY